MLTIKWGRVCYIGILSGIALHVYGLGAWVLVALASVVLEDK